MDLRTKIRSGNFRDLQRFLPRGSGLRGAVAGPPARTGADVAPRARRELADLARVAGTPAGQGQDHREGLALQAWGQVFLEWSIWDCLASRCTIWLSGCRFRTAHPAA